MRSQQQADRHLARAPGLAHELEDRDVQRQQAKEHHQPPELRQ
jgi:hypothetical protein